MKNYILRFESEQMANTCYKHFPEKSTLTGYCIMLKKITGREELQYLNIISLVETIYKTTIQVTTY